MTLPEIIAAVNSGRTVHWCNERYTVKRDQSGDYLIVCDNGYYIGLIWNDGVTINGKPEEFFIA